MLTQIDFELMAHHKGGVMEYIKQRCRQLQLDCTKFFFTSDVIREWNKLPLSVVQCNTINSFKNKHDHHLLQQGFL